MSYPFIAAKHYHPGGNANPTRIVMHRTESTMRPGGARAVARYFASTTKTVSAHLVCDPTEVIRSVRDEDVAYHAPPNSHTLGLEMCGYSRDDDWHTPVGQAELALAAQAVALWCRQYALPAVWLTPTDLRAGVRGITSHANVARAFGQTTHTDPEPHFPVAEFVAMVSRILAPTPPPGPQPVVTHHTLEGEPVATIDVPVQTDANGDGEQGPDEGLHIPIGKVLSVTSHAPHSANYGDGHYLLAPAGYHEARGELVVEVVGGPPNVVVWPRVLVAD